MIESHWPKPSGEPHYGKRGPEAAKQPGAETKKSGSNVERVDDEIAEMKAKFTARNAQLDSEGSERIEQLRAAGEAAREQALKDFDKSAAVRAAEGQAKVDAANSKLAESVEDLKRRLPNL